MPDADSTRGCLLMRVGPGSEDRVVTELSGWPGVRQAFLTWGRFDVVADIRGGDVEDIGQLALKASLLPGVAATETLLGYGPRAEAARRAPVGTREQRALCLILAQAARIPDLLTRLRDKPWVSHAYMLLGAFDIAAFIAAPPAEVTAALSELRGLEGVVSVETLIGSR